MGKIFILGMPGSGKSTMARYLCSQTNFKYLDLDEEIEKKTQMTVKEIFKNKDENYFRSLETDLLAEIIKKDNSFILATGGGTPCFNNNMKIMNKNGCTIFLDISIDILTERVSRKNKRPLLNSENIKEIIINLYNRRIKFYEKSNFSIKGNNREEALSIVNSNS
jgi:shikimate kinase